MTRTQLINALYQIKAVKFGQFKLKSGKISPIYIDLRQIISYPDVLRSVANAIWLMVQEIKFDLICGVPYTALPVATCISLQHNIPMIMRRKEKKSYGTEQQIEGAFHHGQTCLIIEDLITTGSSIIETADDLEAHGLKITDTALLIDREQGGKENLEKRHYRVHAVFTLSEILQTLMKSDRITQEEEVLIKKLLQEPV
ncbi:MAG: Phosphoribosyltransferase, Orotidine 5-phosphate decarboxylase [uncultured bacterium]|nr:MAG: Phosphoribosyltransferase, Orotidine 5-phosphate decarboxylase [uncultured bacterium]